MGKGVAEASPAAHKVFEQADEALGASISKLCFEGPMADLTLTTNTQPAIVTTSSALVAALRERHPALPAPSFAAGHSLGEYSALVAAGALDLADAVRICRLRGAAMQDAVPEGEGAMAAMMGLDGDAIAAICAEAAEGQVVSAANFNAPGQIVIAGHAAAVDRAMKIAQTKGGRGVPLKVSAPFHSALMKPAAVRLATALDAIAVRPLGFPVLANVDGEPNADPDKVRGLLVAQVDSTVQWVKTIERLAAEGVTHALEIGPGKVLAGLVKRIARSIKVHNVSDLASLDQAPSFLSSGAA